MARYIPEDKDLFLDFLEKGDLLIRDLPGRLTELKGAFSSDQADDIHKKINNFAALGQLMGVTALLPAFDLLRLLVKAMDPNDAAMQDKRFAYIDQLLGILGPIFDQWQQQMADSESDAGLIFECRIDPALVLEIRTFCEKIRETPPSEGAGFDAGNTKAAVSGFIEEGVSILQVLKNQLAGESAGADLIPAVQGNLSMLQGNSDILTGLLGSDFAPDHRIYAIADFLDEMSAFLDYQDQHQNELSADVIDRLNLCVDELETLFKDFNKKEPADPGTALKGFRDLVQKIQDEAERSSRETKTTGAGDSESTDSAEKTMGDDGKKESTFLPIKLERIEELGNFVGELIVAQNAFANIKTLVQEADKQTTGEFLKTTEDSFLRIISDLDSLVMKMRMQRVKSLFNRFPRMVRDLSKKTGKKIDLKFSGEDTEIDNRILAEVTDPMMHLVRNSLDHGIEDPEQRRQAGKDPQGLIRLSATNREGRTIIKIYDDGRGIDPEILKKKVVEKGLMSDEDAQKLTDKDARALIFMPGFSTAEAVTQISGRGVGMDVVMENIQNVNGMIDIESQTGKFTEITLSLPLTISVSKGFKIRLGNDIYMVPIDDILKVTDVEKDTIHCSKGFVFTLVDRKLQQIMPINQLLGYPSPIETDQSQIDLVLVKHGPSTAAVAVDEILGIEDIVVKPLPDIDPEVQALYSGCTILSDGGIVLILNMNACLNASK